MKEKKMKLINITDEHIKLLAEKKYYVYPDAVTEIRRSDEWCILFYKRGYETGRLHVSNEEVYFTDDDGRYEATFEVIKFLLDLGYEIF